VRKIDKARPGLKRYNGLADGEEVKAFSNGDIETDMQAKVQARNLI
jgi:hypothetical protein